MRPRLAAAATKWRIRALGLAWRGTLSCRRAMQQGVGSYVHVVLRALARGVRACA